VTLLFGIPLLVGFLLLIVWLSATAVAATVEGWSDVDPDRRFGRTGRFAMAGLIGFGMAGISALYAGWIPLLAVAAGVLGAVLLMVGIVLMLASGE